MNVELKSGPGIRMSSIARTAVVRRRGPLAAAHARIERLRAEPAVRLEAIEQEFTGRSRRYVALCAVLVGHAAILGERLPDELRLVLVVWMFGAWAWWRRARRTSAARGRFAAWAGWGVGCLLATVGIVAARARLDGVIVPAALYGTATFLLGCCVAADVRRLAGSVAVRWFLATFLLGAMAFLHFAYLQLPGSGHG